jgi:type VI secretion system protein ImpH
VSAAAETRAPRRELAASDVVPLASDAGIGDPEALAGALEAARRRGAYPLLLLVERLLGGEGRVGTAATVEEECIRLRHDPQLAFRAGEVSSVRVLDRTGPRGERGALVEIVTSFLGLSGAVSPLPPYLPEEIAQEDEEAPRRREFLDLFHHRFLSLFYRARARGDYPNTYRSDQADAWSERLLSLLGREGPAAVERWRLLRWAPLLAERNVTATALEAAIGDVIAEEMGEVGVTVETFVGGWADVDPEDHNRLGVARSALGRDLVVGRRILDRAGKFRIVVGPLSREAFARISQDQVVLRRVASLVGDLCAGPLEYETVLWLSKDAAPHLELGGARLGRDAWLGGQVREARLRVDMPA